MTMSFYYEQILRKVFSTVTEASVENTGSSQLNRFHRGNARTRMPIKADYQRSRKKIYITSHMFRFRKKIEISQERVEMRMLLVSVEKSYYCVNFIDNRLN